MDYIHYNPVKHGLVEQVGAWRYSTFRRCVEAGWYVADWGGVPPASIAGMDEGAITATYGLNRGGPA